MSPNTDAPDDDYPDAAENNSACPYSFLNRKNKKKNITPNTYAPNNYPPNASGGDAASH